MLVFYYSPSYIIYVRVGILLLTQLHCICEGWYFTTHPVICEGWYFTAHPVICEGWYFTTHPVICEGWYFYYSPSYM